MRTSPRRTGRMSTQQVSKTKDTVDHAGPSGNFYLASWSRTPLIVVSMLINSNS